MQICMYGAGNRCKILLRLIQNTTLNIEVICVVDSDSRCWGKQIAGVEIQSPERLRKLEDTYVCVTFFGEKDAEPIWGELEYAYGIAPARILSFHELITHIFKHDYRIPEYGIELGEEKKTIFAASWNLQLGGVESWIMDSVDMLTNRGKDVYVIAGKERLANSKVDERYIIDYQIADSCQFQRITVDKAVHVLLKHLPCVIVCSRADEIMLAAYLLHQKYPGLLKIVCVIHGNCDGIVRDMIAYSSDVEKYLCVSMETVSAVKKNGVKSDVVELALPPMNNVFFEEREYSVNPNMPLRLGYAGRLEVAQKRADLLLDLISILEKESANYTFEIVGAGSYEGKIMEYISHNELEQKVIFRGQISRDEMMEFWADKDIAINVSDSEGRPIANEEAMLCGAVPVVTATKGILTDVIDGETGFLIEIGNMRAMADRIIDLATNRALVSDVGKAARTSMVRKVDPIRYYQQWNQIMCEEEA